MNKLEYIPGDIVKLNMESYGKIGFVTITF